MELFVYVCILNVNLYHWLILLIPTLQGLFVFKPSCISHNSVRKVCCLINGFGNQSYLHSLRLKSFMDFPGGLMVNKSSTARAMDLIPGQGSSTCSKVQPKNKSTSLYSHMEEDTLHSVRATCYKPQR